MDHSSGLSWLLSLLRSLFMPGIEGWIVILGLIIPYAVKAFKQIRQAEQELGRESGYLQGCRARLKSLRDAGKPPEQADIDNWLSHIDAESRVRKCVDAVWSMRLIPNPDLEAISTMLAQSESHRIEIAKNAPNSLMLSGLLGTVLGLAGAVSKLPQQIQGTLQSADPITLTQNLALTLQHMQSAFACTFWGILGAVIISRMVNQLGARQSAFLSDLQEFGLRQLSPHVIPRSTAAQLDDVRSVLRQSQVFMEQVSGLMKDAAATFNTVLGDAGKAMVSGVQNLQSVVTGLQTSLVQVSSHVLDSAQTLKESAKGLQECHSDLRDAYSAMETFFTKSKDQLERQAEEQLAKMHELQQDFANSAQEIVYAVHGASDGLTGATQAFVNSGKEILEAGQLASAKMDTGFETLTGSFKEALAKHQSELGHVHEGINHVAERIADISERLDPRLLPKGEWQAVVESLNACAEALRTIDDANGNGGPAASSDHAVIEAIRELNQRLDGHNQGLNAVNTALSSAAQKMNKSSDLMENRLPTREEWSALLTSFTSGMKAVENGLSSIGLYGRSLELAQEAGRKGGELAPDGLGDPGIGSHQDSSSAPAQGDQPPSLQESWEPTADVRPSRLNRFVQIFRRKRRDDT